MYMSPCLWEARLETLNEPAQHRGEGGAGTGPCWHQSRAHTQGLSGTRRRRSKYTTLRGGVEKHRLFFVADVALPSPSSRPTVAPPWSAPRSTAQAL
eukprot:scaffold65468_cov40-Tisochrysis_lutea.AAC.1